MFFLPVSFLCSSVWMYAGLCVRSVPKVGPSLQKPFSQYLEAQRNKLHHAGGSAPAVRTLIFIMHHFQVTTFFFKIHNM